MTARRLKVVARFGSPGPLQTFVGGSLFAHALFIAVIVLVPSLRGKKIIEAPLVVDLVAPAPAARAAASVPATPPQPPPKQESEGVRVETRKTQPVPVPKVEKKPEPPPPPGPPASTGPPPPDPAPGEATAAPAEDAGAGTSATVGVLEGGDIAFAWYRSSVTAALHSNWRTPILDGLREAREVTVAFEILRNGSIRDLRLEAASGVPSLDRSALRAVSDAVPLPPLPKGWDEPMMAARFVFRLFPE